MLTEGKELNKKNTKTIRTLGWLPSVRSVPQHCPVSTQCLLMTSVRGKLICRPWEDPGLDIRSAEVKHIRLLTRHCFSLGEKKMKPSLTDTSLQNYKITNSKPSTEMYFIFFVLSFTLMCLFLSYREIQIKKQQLREIHDFKAFWSLILLPLNHKTTGWTFNSFPLCRGIDGIRQVHLFHRHMASQK